MVLGGLVKQQDWLVHLLFPEFIVQLPELSITSYAQSFLTATSLEYKLRIMPYVIILQRPSWVWLTASHADRAPSTSQDSQARKGPSKMIEQWHRTAEPHEQVAVGHKTSRPSGAQMKVQLNKLQRKAEGK